MRYVGARDKKERLKFSPKPQNILLSDTVFSPNLAGKQQMIHSLSFPSWGFHDVLQICRINTFKEHCKSIALMSEQIVCIALCPLLEKSQLIRVCLVSWCFHLDGIKPCIPPRPRKKSSLEHIVNCGAEDDYPGIKLPNVKEWCAVGILLFFF